MTSSASSTSGCTGRAQHLLLHRAVRQVPEHPGGRSREWPQEFQKDSPSAGRQHPKSTPHTSSCQFSWNQTIWSTMPFREDTRVRCSSRCMCVIRLQHHMGAVALMGPGSDAEWDWLPTELGCCCPESESNTHNANVSAKLTDGKLGALRTHRPKERWFLPAATLHGRLPRGHVGTPWL